MKKCKFQLVDYEVNKLIIKRNLDFDSSIECIRISPYMEFKTETINKDFVAVSLSGAVHKGKKKPYSLYVEIRGVFKFENFNEEKNAFMVKNTAIVILFPFLRAAISNLTSLAGFAPLNLPLFAIPKNDYFDEKDIRPF